MEIEKINNSADSNKRIKIGGDLFSVTPCNKKKMKDDPAKNPINSGFTSCQSIFFQIKKLPLFRLGKFIVAATANSRKIPQKRVIKLAYCL